MVLCYFAVPKRQNDVAPAMSYGLLLNKPALNFSGIESFGIVKENKKTKKATHMYTHIYTYTQATSYDTFRNLLIIFVYNARNYYLNAISD